MSNTLRDSYSECLARLDQVDLKQAQRILGLQFDGPALHVPFFNQRHHVAADKILDSRGVEPTDGVGIVVCQYLLRCPDRQLPEGDLVTFREFPGAGPLVSSFASNTNKLIAGTFAERFDALCEQVDQLEGRPVPDQSGYDLFVRFEALPKIPVFMQFNAADDLFPAQCNLLFFESAVHYLDMQSLFIVGTYLSGRLIQGVGV